MPVLVIQKGHCYRKSGSTGTNGEQDYATAVADTAVALLHGRSGWTVKIILADDPRDKYRGDAFAAIHCDGSNDPNAHGASTGYRTEGTNWTWGRDFAQRFKQAYEARGWRGFRADNYTDGLHYYYGTGEARSVGNYQAIIIECGFMTNPDDKAAMTGPGGVERVVRSIGDALGIAHEYKEEEDMAGQYSFPLQPSPVDADGNLVPVETSITIDKGGAAGITRVWMTVFANNDAEGHGLVMTVSHWRVVLSGGGTKPLDFCPPSYQVKPLDYSRPPAGNEAPQGAVSLVIDHVSPNGGSVCVAWR